MVPSRYHLSVNLDLLHFSLNCFPWFVLCNVVFVVYTILFASYSLTLVWFSARFLYPLSFRLYRQLYQPYLVNVGVMVRDAKLPSRTLNTFHFAPMWMGARIYCSTRDEKVETTGATLLHTTTDDVYRLWYPQVYYFPPLLSFRTTFLKDFWWKWRWRQWLWRQKWYASSKLYNKERSDPNTTNCNGATIQLPHRSTQTQVGPN